MYHLYSVAYRFPIIGVLGEIFCLYHQTLIGGFVTAFALAVSLEAPIVVSTDVDI